MLALVGKKKMSKKEALKDVGVLVGSKTTRERFIELLGRHVKRKKVKVDSGLSGPALRSQTISKEVGKIGPSEVVDVVASSPSSGIPQVNFSKYNTLQLSKMLRDVGLDIHDADKDNLVKHCKIYNDLSEFLFLGILIQ